MNVNSNLMYSTQELFNGITNPSLISKEIKRQIQRQIPHDFGIQGSYDTGNIGDKALGKQFKYQLEKEGYTTKTFNKKTESSNTANRVLGGGGVLHDWYGVEHLKRRLNYVSGGKRGFIIGVGVPGFQSAEAQELISRTLPQMELITVRDQWSKQNLENVCDANISVTACPAFLYDDPNVKTTNKTGVNFRPYFDQEDKTDSVLSNYFGYEDLEGANTAYIENAKEICNQIDDPVFIPFHSKDEEFAKKHFDIPILEYEFSVNKTLKRISSVEKMVATRYHSLVFAAVCKKPVLTLAYEPKVEAVAKRLDIPSYKPHKEVNIQFSDVSNIDSLHESAQENFSQLWKLMS